MSMINIINIVSIPSRSSISLNFSTSASYLILFILSERHQDVCVWSHRVSHMVMRYFWHVFWHVSLPHFRLHQRQAMWFALNTRSFVVPLVTTARASEVQVAFSLVSCVMVAVWLGAVAAGGSQEVVLYCSGVMMWRWDFMLAVCFFHVFAVPLSWSTFSSFSLIGYERLIRCRRKCFNHIKYLWCPKKSYGIQFLPGRCGLLRTLILKVKWRPVKALKASSVFSYWDIQIPSGLSSWFSWSWLQCERCPAEATGNDTQWTTVNYFISFADGIKRKVQADELTQQGCKQDVLSILCNC